MRFWWILLAACGSDRVTVPATVVHADVACTMPCTSSLELYGVCMPDGDRIDPDTNEISVVTGLDADRVTGIVEIIYTGSVTSGDKPYLAYILGAGQTAEVDAAGDGAPLYRIDPQHGVVDLDKTRLAGASGDMLRFEYPGTTETHAIDKPRPLAVDVYGDDEPCCSTGRPSTGALLALALVWLTRTSASPRCRRARRPRR